MIAQGSYDYWIICSYILVLDSKIGLKIRIGIERKKLKNWLSFKVISVFKKKIKKKNMKISLKGIVLALFWIVRFLSLQEKVS